MGDHPCLSQGLHPPLWCTPIFHCMIAHVLLQSVHEQFLSTTWLYFLPFSLDLNLAEYINWKIRRLRRGCQENIRMLNLTAFVVSKNFPTMKSVDFISNNDNTSVTGTWLGLMWVIDQRLIHFLFPVTVLRLCSFLQFLGWK